MVETELIPITASLAGAACNPQSADSNGEKWIGTGREIIIIQNIQSANTYTVTFITQTPDNYGEIHNITSNTIPILSSVVLGPFPVARFNDTSDYVHMSYTGHAPYLDLRVQLIRI